MCLVMVLSLTCAFLQDSKMGMINTESTGSGSKSLVYMTNAEHLYLCRVPGRTYFIMSQKTCILLIFMIRTTVIVVLMSIITVTIIYYVHVWCRLCQALG